MSKESQEAFGFFKETKIKSERGKPVYTAICGNVRVPVYRHGKSFCVAWRAFAGAKRERAIQRKKSEAITKADETAKAIANGQSDVVTLTSADRDNYRLAIQALGPLGIPLHAAIAEYVAAKAKIGNFTLAEAAEFFRANRVEKIETPPTLEIVKKVATRMRDDRRSEDCHVRPFERDMARFSEAFPQLEKVSEDDIRDYLGKLRATKAARGPGGEIIPKGSLVSLRRRDNVRDRIATLMIFAKERGFLPDKKSAAELVPRLSEGREVTTLDPDRLGQALAYFAEHDPDWLPWAALGAFGGLRTSEIFRLEWSAVKWELGTIAVKRSVARKVKVARRPPINDALRSWLLGCLSAAGFVVPRKWKDLESAHADALARFEKAMGWRLPKNVFRHSFGSHRLAILKDAGEVAHEMGNSAKRVLQDYNDPKSEEEGKAYFASRPEKTTSNIIAFQR